MRTDPRGGALGSLRGAIFLAPAFALALALGGACSPNSPSFVVLDLEHDPMETSVTEIPGVTAVEVDVSGGTPVGGATQTRMLTYDAGVVDGGSLTIQNPPALGTLSVEFSGSQHGTVSFDVKLKNAQDCVVGEGTGSAVLRPGGIVEIPVPIRSALVCGGGQDGGTPDAADAGPSFPGCDPVDPSAGATMCTAVQTCQVNCTSRKTECIMGGAGAPGARCTTNADCEPGTQCFDYSSLGCTGVKVCLRFCSSNATCAAVADGGTGPGSFCEGRVPCGGVDTSYHTCTFSCDPSSSAVATHGGCPTGLACVLFGAGDQVDCTCPAATQTKTEGQSCTTGADCAPGLLCNAMSGTTVCRPICPCNAVGNACSVNANSCPTTGTRCVPLTNNTRYGVCL